jgi:ABC-type glycerol-3-phosphate transport system permease component
VVRHWELRRRQRAWPAVHRRGEKAPVHRPGDGWSFRGVTAVMALLPAVIVTLFAQGCVVRGLMV